MANELNRLGGGEEAYRPFELIEILDCDGNDFTATVGFRPRKVVIIASGAADMQSTHWFGATGSLFANGFRQGSTVANGGTFHTAPTCSVAQSATDGTWTITVDASEAVVASGSDVLLEVWRW